MNIKHVSPFAIATMLLAACESELPVPHQVRSAEVDDARVVAIVHEYEEATAEFRQGGGRQKPDTTLRPPDLCLRLDSGADRARVVRELARHAPRVWPADGCSRAGDGLVASATGARAVAVGIERLQEVRPGEVVVDVGWVLAGLWGKGHRITLRWQRGRWRVAEAQSTWVS